MEESIFVRSTSGSIRVMSPVKPDPSSQTTDVTNPILQAISQDIPKIESQQVHPFLYSYPIPNSSCSTLVSSQLVMLPTCPRPDPSRDEDMQTSRLVPLRISCLRGRYAASCTHHIHLTDEIVLAACRRDNILWRPLHGLFWSSAADGREFG